MFIFIQVFNHSKRKKGKEKWEYSIAAVLANSLAALFRSRNLLFARGQAGAISAVGKARNWRKCIELFQEMKKNGVQPNAVTYFSMVMILGQNGQGQTALQYFEDMRVRDSA